MDKNYEPQMRYDSTHTRKVTLKLNLKTDQDVIAWLDSQENKQGRIKELIRNDIRNGSK